jgi:hypothetical protein
VEVDYRENGGSTNKQDADEPVTDRMFRNRGLETFLQVQKMWRESSSSDSHLDYLPSPSHTLRQEMSHRGTNAKRQELSKRIPLSDVIDMYSQKWNSEGAM